MESAAQTDVLALIEALDAFQQPLYPAESHHGIDLAALSQPNVLFAVARDETGVARGCGAMVLSDGYGELKRMYTDPAMRGRGIAATLLACLEQTAASQGISLYRLETGFLQPDAIRLYERHGYARRGPFGDYTDDPNSVFMEKATAPTATDHP